MLLQTKKQPLLKNKHKKAANQRRAAYYINLMLYRQISRRLTHSLFYENEHQQ